MVNPLTAIILFCLTFILFKWVFKVSDTLYKLFVILLILFIYLYCGLGVGYAETDFFEYEVCYVLYMLSLSLSLKFFLKRDYMIPLSTNINSFCTRHSTIIICFYFLTILMPLAQSGKLGLLVNPPAPSLIEHFADVDFSKNKVSGAFDSIKNFVVPLFYLALTKYIYRPKILIPLFLFPQYVTYCNASYMGRGSMAFILIYIFIYYYVFFPEKRKLLVTIATTVVPFIIVFFAAYVYIRQGVAVDAGGFMDSLNFLIQSETYYYSWYYDIVGDTKYLLNYIVWFVTLPLPGFLKPFSMSFSFNALFTQEVSGLGSLSDVTSIALPGLVNESIFIFGRTFFFLHAIVMAWVFSITYNTLSKNRNNFLPLLSTMLVLAIQTPRGGTSGPYSDALKLVFTFFLFYCCQNIFGNKSLK